VESEPYLLDSSALLTLIEDEPGAERVEAILRTKPCLIPWLAVLEVHYITQQEQGVDEAERRLALLEHLPGEILWQADASILRVELQGGASNLARRRGDRGICQGSWRRALEQRSRVRSSQGQGCDRESPLQVQRRVNLLGRR
jgi:hypothetical protein